MFCFIAPNVKSSQLLTQIIKTLALHQLCFTSETALSSLLLRLISLSEYPWKPKVWMIT